MTLGKIIRELRKGTGTKQREMATRVGVSIDTYRRWEWGKFQPRADQLIRLAGALGTTVEKLLHQEEATEHEEGGTCGAENAGAGAPGEC